MYVLQTKAPDYDKAYELISTLKARGPLAFQCFIEALKESNQEYLAEKLTTCSETASGPSTSSQAILGTSPMPQKIRTIVQHLKMVYRNDCEIMKQHWIKLFARFPADFENDKMYAELEIMEEDRSSGRFIHTYQDMFGPMGEDGIRNYTKIVITGSDQVKL